MGYAPRGGFMDPEQAGGYGMEEDWMGQQLAYSGAQPSAANYGFLGTQPQAFSTGYPSSKPPTFPPGPPIGAEFSYQGEAAEQRPVAGAGPTSADRSLWSAASAAANPPTGRMQAQIQGASDLLRVLQAGGGPPPPPAQAPHVPPSQPTQPPPSAPQGPPPTTPAQQMIPAERGAAWSIENRSRADADANKDPSALERRAKEFFGLIGLLKALAQKETDLIELTMGTEAMREIHAQSAELSGALGGAGENMAAASRKEPEFYLPPCYYVNPPQLKTAHLQKFSLETLFYIFFNMPRDMLQAYAAAELYNRGWKFHRDMQQWLILQEGEDKVHRWVYFDENRWERKWHPAEQPVDSNRFLAEDDVRVGNVQQQAN